MRQSTSYPVIDEAYQASLRRLMGVGFDPTMRRFAEHLRQARSQLAMDLDRPGLLRLVHKLAGTGGMLGFTDLSHRAAALQERLLGGGPGEAEDYQHLIQALERILIILDGDDGRPQPSSSS